MDNAVTIVDSVALPTTTSSPPVIPITFNENFRFASGKLQRFMLHEFLAN